MFKKKYLILKKHIINTSQVQMFDQKWVVLYNLHFFALEGVQLVPVLNPHIQLYQADEQCNLTLLSFYHRH